MGISFGFYVSYADGKDVALIFLVGVGEVAKLGLMFYGDNSWYLGSFCK